MGAGDGFPSARERRSGAGDGFPSSRERRFSCLREGMPSRERRFGCLRGACRHGNRPCRLRPAHQGMKLALPRYPELTAAAGDWMGDGSCGAGIRLGGRNDGCGRLTSIFVPRVGKELVPRKGLEPPLPFGKRILSPPRLPFRHLGTEDGDALHYSPRLPEGREGPGAASPPRRSRPPRCPWSWGRLHPLGT